MRRLYLDMNVFNRPFDDQSQVKIRLETIATHAVLRTIKDKKFALLWSFMLEFENSLNPYEDIRMEIKMASSLASDYVDISDDVITAARNFESAGIKPRDSVHIACAVKSKADYLLTCDEKLIKKASGFIEKRILIINPVDFIRLEVR